MIGYLYLNQSANNVLNKKLINKSEALNLHFKENSSIVNPTFMISRNINMKDYNYIEVPDFHRFYYIEDVTVSQQYYIVTCKSDPLYSFRTVLKQTNVLLDRSANNGVYSYDLEDDKYKIYQYTHCDVYSFPGSGFDPEKQEFLLTVCGNPDVNASIDSSKDNNSGSTINHNKMDQEQYESLTPEEKHNDTINTISNVSGSPAFNEQTLYRYITESQYNNLITQDKNNGTFYYLSNKANGTKGDRIIKVRSSYYDSYTTKAKNNSTPYLVSSN